MCPSPARLIPFTVEEITVCSNEADRSANKEGRNSFSCFYISFFTLLVNTFESSHDFMILIISFISSFEINKLLFILFFFKIYLLYLKLNCLRIQLNYLLLKEKQGWQLVFYLNYQTYYEKNPV